MSKDRVVVVGVGNVGATTAYALLLSGLAPDIVLINRDRKKAEGEAEDISHAEPWSHTTLVRVLRSTLRDQNTVLTVGSQMPEALGLGDVTMSLPTIVNGRGIGGVVPLNLDPAEHKALTSSIQGIQRQIAVIEEAATAS
jgi:malate/lactate dehydrogenase